MEDNLDNISEKKEPEEKKEIYDRIEQMDEEEDLYDRIERVEEEKVSNRN